MSEPERPNIDFSLYYASRGWNNSPVEIKLTGRATDANRKKDVYTRMGWRESSTTDPKILDEWFVQQAAAHPRQGIGITTGRKSNLWVVDIDNTYQWERFLTERGYVFPETYTVVSQSGSMHKYLQFPDDLVGSGTGILLEKEWDDYAEKFSGVEIRGEGGLIFAPPTRTYDSAGEVVGQYIKDPKSPLDVAKAPQWLVDFYNAKPKAGGREERPRINADEFYTLYPDGINEKHAKRETEFFRNWARERFQNIASSSTSQWDNETTQVVGILVRLVNSPWADFDEDDLERFMEDEAPFDEGFNKKEHTRIVNSCFRMANGEILDYEDRDVELEALIAKKLAENAQKLEAEQIKEASHEQLATIPDEFWNSRPLFAQIRQGAHAKYQSADAALHAFLAAYAARVPYGYQIDTGIGNPVNIIHFVALVGGSGTGKGGATGQGFRLANNDMQPTPLGSGEGIAEFFLDKVVDEDDDNNYREDKKTGDLVLVANPTMKKVQVRHNILISETEGSNLSTLIDRESSTLGSTLLKLGMGEALGQTNASAETSRYIPEGSYSCGLVVGFQIMVSGQLLDTSETGLTQRFIWSSVIDPSFKSGVAAPSTVDYWEPLPIRPVMGAILPKNIDVDPSIIQKLQDEREMILRGVAQADPLDSHRPARMLQLSALLRMLDGPNIPDITGDFTDYQVTTDDWRYAAMLYDTSRRVRQQLVARVRAGRALEDARQGEKDARRAVARQGAEKSMKVVKARLKIFEVIDAAEELGQPCRKGMISRAVTGDTRFVNEMLDDLKEDGLIIYDEVTKVFSRAPEEDTSK